MLGQRIGYIRVSTLDQHIDRQLEGIEVDKTFIDTASGKDTKRPQLELLLSFARTGDTVIVHSMDRLARNLDDLRRIVQTLTGRGVRIEFVKEHLSFTGDDSPMASLMLSVMGAFAHIPPNLVVDGVPAQRKPPEVRICKLSIQSAVGTRPPSTSTPHCPACLARR
jgi:DNA invertase Pin-like site-specific DNA recombinase